jgi:hypothetical protein
MAMVYGNGIWHMANGNGNGNSIKFSSAFIGLENLRRQ